MEMSTKLPGLHQLIAELERLSGKKVTLHDTA